MVRFNKDAHLQLTHVWGIGGQIITKKGLCENEGWDGKWSIETPSKRLKLLSASLKKHHIFFGKIAKSFRLSTFYAGVSKHCVTDLKAEFEVLKKGPNASIIHLAVDWENHILGFHIIKTATGFDIVYVNRGSEGLASYGEIVKCTHPIQVFSFSRTMGEIEVDNLIDVISPKKTIASRQDRIARVVNGWPDKASAFYFLPKTHQTVGNCTVANTNVSWLIHIACHFMRKKPELSLPAAVKKAKPFYKLLRLHDRAWQLINLLWHKHDYPKKSFNILLTTILVKTYFKNKNNPAYTLQLLMEMEKAHLGSVTLLQKEYCLLSPAILKGSSINPEWLNVLKASTRAYTEEGGQELLTLPNLKRMLAHWQKIFRIYRSPSISSTIAHRSPKILGSLFAPHGTPTLPPEASLASHSHPSPASR